jgi:hypothetical protein
MAASAAALIAGEGGDTASASCALPPDRGGEGWRSVQVASAAAVTHSRRAALVLRDVTPPTGLSERPPVTDGECPVTGTLIG